MFCAISNTARLTLRIYVLLLVGLLAGDVPALAAEARKSTISRAEKLARARASYYRVRRGDTLTKIARRFRTSTALLTRWNKLPDPGDVQAGTRLLVPVRPKQPARRRKRALKPSEIEKSAWKSTPLGTKVLLPSDYSLKPPGKLEFAHELLDVVVYARSFTQGEAAYLELRRKKGVSVLESEVAVRFAGASVPLTRTDYGYRALIAFSPYRKPGKEKLLVTVTRGGKKNKGRFLIPIARGDFKTVVWKTFLGNYDKKRPTPTAAQRRAAAERARKARELVRASTIKKKEAFAKRTADKLDSRLAHPRGHHIVTDPFFVNRRIARYYIKNRRKHWKKQFTRMHHGLDLHGSTGAPIYALAAGVVVAAQQMFYEGNFTVIDHGHGVFTGYMHQSKLLVKEGDVVKAGQLIGEVGATGRVTGPHLHAGLYIRDIPVHPLSLLSLPIR